MKRLLLATTTNEVAGAERIIAHLLNEQSGTYQLDLCTLRRSSDTAHTLPANRNWRDLLWGDYDLIHTHLFLPGLLARMRRFYDAKFRWIHTVHYSSYEGQRWGHVKQWLDRHLIFPRADRLVAVSPTVVQSLLGLRRVQLIENGVHLHKPTQPARELTSFRVGSLAMLRSEKGLDDLIHAVHRARQRLPTLELHLAGSGPERSNLEELVASLNLQGCVKFVGYATDPAAFYQSLDAYVTPSHSESFGMAALEAFTHQVPQIAARVGNLTNVLQDGRFGILVRRDEDFVAHLAEALIALFTRLDYWQGQARAGFHFWSERLDVKTMVHAYECLYQSELAPGVCMISPIVTQATGGLQRQLFLQSRELVRRGHRVFVLQRRDSQLRSPELQKKWSHVEFWTTPDLSPMFGKDHRALQRLRGFAFVVFGFFTLWRHRRDVALIHAHQLFSPTVVGALSKICFGHRLIVKVTASGELGELHELQRLPLTRLRRFLFRQIDRLIVLTDEMKNEMHELGFVDRQIALIPNSVAVPESTAMSARSSSLRILYCGRLSDEKDLPTLLAAADLLAAKGVPCVVHLVGGTYGGRDVTRALHQQAEHLHPAVSVQFHGSQKDVVRFYHEADVFVLPSRSEGLSNSLLEAMAFGLPCVASDIGPNRFVIKHEQNGLLFRQGNAQDLAHQLFRLAQPGSIAWARELSAHARETITTRFSVQQIGDRLVHLYREVHSGGPT